MSAPTSIVWSEGVGSDAACKDTIEVQLAHECSMQDDVAIVSTNFVRTEGMRRRGMVLAGGRIVYSSGKGEGVRSVLNDKHATSAKFSTKLKGTISDMCAHGESFAISDSTGNINVFSKWPQEAKVLPVDTETPIRHSHLAFADEDSLISLASDASLREYRIGDDTEVTVLRDGGDVTELAWNALAASPKGGAFATISPDLTQVQVYAAGADRKWSRTLEFCPFESSQLAALEWIDVPETEEKATGRTSPPSPSSPTSTSTHTLLITISASLLLRVWAMPEAVSAKPQLLFDIALPTAGVVQSATRICANNGPTAIVHWGQALALHMRFGRAEDGRCSVAVERQDMSGAVMEYCVPRSRGKICFIDESRLATYPNEAEGLPCTLAAVPFGSHDERVICMPLPPPAFAASAKKMSPVVKQIAGVKTALQKLNTQSIKLREIGARLDAISDEAAADSEKAREEEEGTPAERYARCLEESQTQLATYLKSDVDASGKWDEQLAAFKEAVVKPTQDHSSVLGTPLLNQAEVNTVYQCFRGGPAAPSDDTVSEVVSEQASKYSGPTAYETLLEPEIKQIKTHPRTMARRVIAEEIAGVKKLEAAIMKGMSHSMEQLLGRYLENAADIKNSVAAKLADRSILPAPTATGGAYFDDLSVQRDHAFAEVHEGCADVKTSQLQVREKLLPSVLSLIDSFREDPEDHTLREDSVMPEDSVSAAGTVTLDSKAAWRRLIQEGQYNDCVCQLNQHSQHSPEEESLLQWFREETYKERAEIAREMGPDAMVALLRDAWISLSEAPNDGLAIDWIIALGEEVNVSAMKKCSNATSLLQVVQWGIGVTNESKEWATQEQKEGLDVLLFNLEE